VSEHLPGAPRAANPRDPHHAERVRLTREATVAEYGRLARTVAPEMRTLAARFYARRLGVAELNDAARFFSSPGGRRFMMGSIEMGGHVDALRGFQPQPSPQLIEAGARVAARIESETRHLNPPRGAANRPRADVQVTAPPAPPPPPPPPRSSSRRAPPPDMAPAAPMAPPAPPPPPADPARLAAATRTAAAMLPDEAFAQPLPLEALAETLMALPISSFGPVPAPPGLGPNASVGQAIEAHDPRGRERIAIIARIVREELPRIGPLAAPLMRGAVAELYARTFTVSELEEVTRFYETPAGRALSRESFTALADPEFVRGAILMIPRAITEGMGAMVRVGQATAHLPPPPPEAAPPPPRRRDRSDPTGED
jgi:hypothetical protein